MGVGIGPRGAREPGVGTVLAADLAALRAFAADRRPVLFLQGLLFVLLLGVTRSIRDRARAWEPADPRAASPRIIFERNVSAAALVTLLCTPLFHPYPPGVVVHVVTVTALVPILRLLPALVGPALSSAVFAVAGLVALDQVRELVGVAVLPARLRVLGSLVAAAVLVSWLLRRRRLRAGPAAPGPVRGLVPLLRLAQGLLLVGIAATLLGWVRLGRLLYVDVLSPAYLALAIFGALQVLRTTLDILLRSGRAQQLRIVAVHGALVRERLSRVLGLVGVLLWVGFCLRGVDLDGALVALAERVLDAELTIGSLTLRLGNVVAFAVALVVAAYVARFVRFVLQEDVFTRSRCARGVPNTISTTVHYAHRWRSASLLALVGRGLRPRALHASSLGALGVGIGFGLQNVVNNFVSGLILLFERPVQIGDTIEVGSAHGRGAAHRHPLEHDADGAGRRGDRAERNLIADRGRELDAVGPPAPHRLGSASPTAPTRGASSSCSLEVARGHVEVLDQPAPVVLSSASARARSTSSCAPGRCVSRLAADRSELDAGGVARRWRVRASRFRSRSATCTCGASMRPRSAGSPTPAGFPLPARPGSMRRRTVRRRCRSAVTAAPVARDPRDPGAATAASAVELAGLPRAAMGDTASAA